MKRTILPAVLLALASIASCSNAAAASKASADTIPADPARITKIVTDTTTTAKGKQRIDHYLLIDRRLYKTTKTSVKQLQLARRHGATVELLLVPAKSKAIIR